MADKIFQKNHEINLYSLTSDSFNKPKKIYKKIYTIKYIDNNTIDLYFKNSVKGIKLVYENGCFKDSKYMIRLTKHNKKYIKIFNPTYCWGIYRIH